MVFYINDAANLLLNKILRTMKRINTDLYR